MQTERLDENEQDTKGNGSSISVSRIHHIECVDQQFIDGLRAGLQIQILSTMMKSCLIFPPHRSQNRRAEWENIASKAVREDDYLTFRQYQTTRIAAGVDTEPQEREWLNYESLMDGGYYEWLSTEVYKRVGSKK